MRYIDGNVQALKLVGLDRRRVQAWIKKATKTLGRGSMWIQCVERRDAKTAMADLMSRLHVIDEVLDNLDFEARKEPEPQTKTRRRQR
jgi:hypothetical protein